MKPNVDIFYDSFKTRKLAERAVEYLTDNGYKAKIKKTDSQYTPYNVYRSIQFPK